MRKQRKTNYQKYLKAFPFFMICITSCLSLFLTGHLVGIGVGTILAMLGVGRVIAVFNHFTYEKLAGLAGIEREERI